MIANASLVAAVTLTVTTVAVRITSYVKALCPRCRKRVADVPAGGEVIVCVRDSHEDLSGGIAVMCYRCRVLVEVTRHG